MSTAELQGNSGGIKPDVPAMASRDKGDAPLAEPVENEEQRGDIWGHASLYLVFFSFILYKVWQITFEYPASVQVLVPGVGSLDTKTWSALINGLGGWLSLSAIVSLAQPGRFVRNLLRPLYAIEDEYIRKVFRSPAALCLSIVIFGVTLSIVTCNVAVRISSEYEILACLPTGHGSGKLVKEDIIEDDVRLGKGESVRLLLRGWGAREVLLIRDRYNLTTLESIEVRRSFFSFGFLSLPLKIDQLPVKASQDGAASLEKDSPFSLHNRGSLSHSNRAVLMAIMAADGVTLYPGRLLVGEPEDGPEDPPNADPAVTLFFKDLWTARALFATWTTGHQRYVDTAGLVLHHPTQNYNNRILFMEGSIAWDQGRRLAETKEAVLLISRKSDLPPTGITLSTTLASIEANPSYQVVGLRRPVPGHELRPLTTPLQKESP